MKQSLSGEGEGSVPVLAGHAGIELRDDLLPAGAFERGVTEVGRDLEVGGAGRPDVGDRSSAVNRIRKRAGHAGGLALAEISLASSNCQAWPPRLTELSILGERREAFHRRGSVSARVCCSWREADRIRPALPQIGVDALLGRAEVADGIQLIRCDAASLPEARRAATARTGHRQK